MQPSIIGGILMIAGTSIGAGMLALPISAAQTGFLPGIIMLMTAWAVMTFSAFLILEVNLWLPENNNYISMCKATLGKVGLCLAWLLYLCLFYSLVAVYTSGGRDIISHFLANYFAMPAWVSATLYAALIGALVYSGIKVIDLFNRGLMIIKIIIYSVLIIIVGYHINITQLYIAEYNMIIGTVTVMITAFGWSIIIPSLSIYYQRNITLLRKIIFFGSLVPLTSYILWITLIMGVIPRLGQYGLIDILQSDATATGVATSIEHFTGSNLILILTKIFTTLTITTSLIGVTLCLSDFFSDGMRLKREGGSRLLTISLTLIPPLFILLFYPKIFMTGLRFAGLCTVILLVLLPALMAWRGRYHLSLAKKSSYQVMGGKLALSIIIFSALTAISIGIFYDLDIQSYLQ